MPITMFEATRFSFDVSISGAQVAAVVAVMSCVEACIFFASIEMTRYENDFVESRGEGMNAHIEPSAARSKLA